MSRPVRVAAVQLHAHDRGGFPSVLDGILDAARDAARTAELVVLPEATFPAYVLGRRPIAADETQRAVDALCAIARETATIIVAGIAMAKDDGSVRNGAVVVEADGSVAGSADKLFLWHFDRHWFAPGDNIAPVQTSLGTLGVLICADGRLPTIAGALVDRGASALVMPTAWVTSGRDPAALENVQADLLARVRAYENGVPFIAANKCGVELGMVAYCGKSQIVAASGEVVALANELIPETLYASISLDVPKPRRGEPVDPPARHADAMPPLRVAMSYDPLPADIDQRLELLDDAFAIAPADDRRFALLGAAVPAAWIDDATALDPGGCVPYRRAGYCLLCWTSDTEQPWLERVARARALELRLYVVVFDRRMQRAFAVDPDGVVVAGTFDDYRIASFLLDPRKTRETAVAPGTDVQVGLERIAAILTR